MFNWNKEISYSQALVNVHRSLKDNPKSGWYRFENRLMDDLTGIKGKNMATVFKGCAYYSQLLTFLGRKLTGHISGIVSSMSLMATLNLSMSEERTCRLLLEEANYIKCTYSKGYHGDDDYITTERTVHITADLNPGFGDHGWWQAGIRKFGISVIEAVIMWELMRKRQSKGSLARVTGMDRGTVTKAINHLIELDLVDAEDPSKINIEKCGFEVDDTFYNTDKDEQDNY